MPMSILLKLSRMTHSTSVKTMTKMKKMVSERSWSMIVRLVLRLMPQSKTEIAILTTLRVDRTGPKKRRKSVQD